MMFNWTSGKRGFRKFQKTDTSGPQKAEDVEASAPNAEKEVPEFEKGPSVPSPEKDTVSSQQHKGLEHDGKEPLMRMFHWSSGKDGLEELSPEKDDTEPNKLYQHQQPPPPPTDSELQAPRPPVRYRMFQHSGVPKGKDSQAWHPPPPAMFRHSSGKAGFEMFPSSLTPKQFIPPPPPQPPPPPTDSELQAPRPSSNCRMFQHSSGKASYEMFAGSSTAVQPASVPPPQLPPPPQGQPLVPKGKDSQAWHPPPPAMFRHSSGKAGFGKFPGSLTPEQFIPPPPPQPRPPTVMSPSKGKEGAVLESSKADGTLDETRPYFTANRELVMSMLKREQDLRFCETTQRLYDGQRWEQPSVPPTTIEDSIQRQVLREHGLDPSDSNVDLYRCLNGLYLEDPEVRQLIVYMKNDRSREGTLRPGHTWPDVDLVTLDKEKVKLSDFYKDKDRLFVIIGASRS